MKLPCEYSLWYVLPRIRADLTRELIKKGMMHKEIAQKLGVTTAAVSQYLHKKRGGKVKMPADYKRKIAKTAEEIRKTESTDEISKLICRCCMGSRAAE